MNEHGQQPGVHQRTSGGMPTLGFEYLATPYTHKSAHVRELRYLAARIYTTNLMKAGFVIFSPIVHCHTLALHGDLPKDIEFWKHYDLCILSRAYRLRILRLPGWEHSKGVDEEYRFAKDHKIDITYDDPNEELRELASCLYRLSG